MTENTERPARSALLSDADELVNGDRQADYGPPELNFTRIAAGWNWWLASTGRQARLTPIDVAEMLGLLKTARIAETPSHRDSYVDRLGYAALAGELAEDEKNRVPSETCDVEDLVGERSYFSVIPPDPGVALRSTLQRETQHLRRNELPRFTLSGAELLDRARATVARFDIDNPEVLGRRIHEYVDHARGDDVSVTVRAYRMDDGTMFINNIRVHENTEAPDAGEQDAGSDPDG